MSWAEINLLKSIEIQKAFKSFVLGLIKHQLDQNTSPMPKVFFQPFRYAAIIGEPFGNDTFVVKLFFGA